MSNRMLCMRHPNVGVRIYDVKVKMIHVKIHVDEEQQNTNDDRNLNEKDKI